MELIIHILMLFIVINCSFKLSFWKLWQTVIYSLIAGLFVAGTWQYAILQSKTQIADYLQNTEALQNMAIIITLESALCFGYCVAFLRGLYGRRIYGGRNYFAGIPACCSSPYYSTISQKLSSGYLA